MKARRYQLTKDALAVIARGHPWLFRDSLSSAANVFADGDLLRLVDGVNATVAYGLFEAEGAIAVRIVRRGPDRPDAAWLAQAIAAAHDRRTPLAVRTTGIRLVHGESDHIPAVVVDQFGDTAVVSSYSAGSDVYARYVAHKLHTPNVVLRPAHRRHSAPPLARTLRGAPPKLASFVEDNLAYTVDLDEGQKTGAYLDLRGLRHAIATAPLAGARVLNLFAYTGMLGRAAEHAGATQIVHVDQSQRALDFARTHHATHPVHSYITADIFDWLPTYAPGTKFELVIVDPPAMTSQKSQVPKVLAAYRKLYRTAREHVAPGGSLVAACCTSRVERTVFRETVRTSLGEGFTLETELPVELDHPVGFPQADYLKIGWWRRT